MRRFVALAMVAALVSVSSLPLLPASVICADAAERIGDHAMVMQTGIKYSIHHNATLHQHNKQLTPAEKECRIECGDGCHASLDGLPHQLAPHTVLLTGFDADLFISAIAATNLPVLKPRLLPFPVPPPRYI